MITTGAKRILLDHCSVSLEPELESRAGDQRRFHEQHLPTNLSMTAREHA